MVQGLCNWSWWLATNGWDHRRQRDVSAHMHKGAADTTEDPEIRVEGKALFWRVCECVCVTCVYDTLSYTYRYVCV